MERQSETEAERRRHERRELRARLAATRSQLLWELLRLDAQALTRAQLANGPTPADLLSRLAAEDNAATETVLRHLGWTRSIPPGHRGSGGEQIFEGVLAASLGARAAFLDALALVPDADLDRSATTEPPRALAEQRARADEAAAQALREWPERQNPAIGPGSLLVAALRAARKELLTVVALIRERERRSWAVHDGRTLLALMVDLARHDHVLRRDLLGAPGPRPPALAESSELSWAGAWRELHDTRQALLVTLEAASHQKLTEIGPGGAATLYEAVVGAVRRDRETAQTLRQSVASTTTPP
jgi:hypothetical protein